MPGAPNRTAQLKQEARPRIIQAIAEARATATSVKTREYHAARSSRHSARARIKELEHDLSHCEIIDVSRMPKTDRVVFGATVDLEDQDGGSPITFQIVGEPEADVRLGLISITSPIARALVATSPRATSWMSRCLAAHGPGGRGDSLRLRTQPGSRMPGFPALRR